MNTHGAGVTDMLIIQTMRYAIEILVACCFFEGFPPLTQISGESEDFNNELR